MRLDAYEYLMMRRQNFRAVVVCALLGAICALAAIGSPVPESREAAGTAEAVSEADE